MQKSQEKPLLKLKSLSPMEKVFPSREPSTDGDAETLSGLRGETVSFQIAYYWAGEVKRYGRCEICSPLAAQVRVRKVSLVPCAYPCHPERDADYLSYEPGMYPDLLEEIPPNGFPLVRGQWRSLWVDIEIPQEQAAGEYELVVRIEVTDGLLPGGGTCASVEAGSAGENAGAVCVETAGEQNVGMAAASEVTRRLRPENGGALGDALTVRKKLRVVGASLPPLPIAHTEWFHADCLAEYYGVEVFSEQHWRIMENFVRTAARRGCNMLLTPVFTPPLDTAVGGERRTVQLVGVEVCGDGKYAFSFDRLERWVEMAQRCGIRYFEISHLFSQWGAVAAPKIVATENGVEKKLFGWETDAAGPEYRAFLHRFLTALKDELGRLGIAERTYFHISDEPQPEQIETYRAARQTVEKELAGFPIFDALSDYAFYKEGLVDCPVCALDHIGAFLQDRPKKLWGYYCTGQARLVSNRFIAMPGYRTRILGAQLYKFRLDGFLHWGYNFYHCERSLYCIDPYRTTDADSSFPSGDPFLVYPGADGTARESVRLLLMEEAMNDVRALYCLEALAGREAALAVIAEAEAQEGETLAFDRYPKNAAFLTRLRARVNEEIAARCKTETVGGSD